MGLLEDLGISERQETIYYGLIDNPGADVEQLAARGGLPRATVARALAQLHRQGLVTRMPGRAPRYKATPPAVALEVLVRQRAERLEEVRQRIAELAERFSSASRWDSAEDMFEIVHGNDAIHQRFLQLQRSAREVVRVFDKPPYVNRGNPDEPGMLHRGVAYRAIYDRAALEVPGKLADMWAAHDAGEEFRVAPDLPLKLFIADRRMALAPLREATDLDGAIVVYASSLLDALIALFEAVWSRAIPLTERAASGGGDDALSSVQRRLIDLLNAGLTDEAIARHLGVGYRTVQRRISELMEFFGATTRFQLGVQTARSRLDG